MEKKIPDTSGLVKKIDCGAMISEIERKISSNVGLATTSALTAVENKIHDVNILVKKTDCIHKISEIEMNIAVHNHDKDITIPEFNKFTAEVLAARLAQANLIPNTDFHAKMISLNKKSQLK